MGVKQRLAAYGVSARDLLRHRFVLVFLVPVLLVIAGTLGYCVIGERYSLLDGLYMTVITLATIGYGEVHPLTPAGRVFTIVLILGGVYALAYAGTAIIRGIVSGEIHHALGR